MNTYRRRCILSKPLREYDHGRTGLDWQILPESDFSVNSFEKNMPEEAIKKMSSRVFKTGSGIALLNNQYGYDM